MDNKKIFIASLRQGHLVFKNLRLIVVALLISSLTSPHFSEKTTALLSMSTYDEFHNFHGFNEMVSGIRKFGISLTFSHQYISQLPQDLADAMLGTGVPLSPFRSAAMTPTTPLQKNLSFEGRGIDGPRTVHGLCDDRSQEQPSSKRSPHPWLSTQHLHRSYVDGAGSE